MSNATFFSSELLHNFRKSIRCSDIADSNRPPKKVKQNHNNLDFEVFLKDLEKPPKRLLKVLKKPRRGLLRDLKEPPIGWSLGYLETDVFSKTFTSLTLKEGYKIYIFKWRDKIGGYGIPYCLPTSLSGKKVFFKWISKNEGKEREQFTKPENALDNFMEAINGDGTPLSYISASIFFREVNELGAFWHGMSWSTHSFIDKDPDELYFSHIKNKKDNHSDFIDEFGNLTWNETKPNDWLPVVYEQDGKVIVKFYTYSCFLRARVLMHQDNYKLGKYLFESKTTTLALGEGGLIP